MLKNAHFNEERTHRYSLARIWNPKGSLLMFVGLNPSTANETDSDPTITRLITFTKNHGFGGFYIVNLSSFISSDPKKLEEWVEGCSENEWIKASKANRKVILDVWRWCSVPVFMWGANNTDVLPTAWVKRRFPDAKCFGHTKDGHPKHPLYLPNETILVDFFPRIRK